MSSDDSVVHKASFVSVCVCVRVYMYVLVMKLDKAPVILGKTQKHTQALGVREGWVGDDGGGQFDATNSDFRESVIPVNPNGINCNSNNNDNNNCENCHKHTRRHDELKLHHKS